MIRPSCRSSNQPPNPICDQDAPGLLRGFRGHRRRLGWLLLASALCALPSSCRLGHRKPPPRLLEQLLPGTWTYNLVEDLPTRDQRLLRVRLARPEPSDEDEVRLLLDRRGPRSFCCLRLRAGQAELLKVADGVEAPLIGTSTAPLPPSLDGLEMSLFRESGGRWTVAWAGAEQLTVVDPVPHPGEVAIGNAGAMRVAAITQQPLASIHYRDDFGRNAFTDGQLYDVWSGTWQLSKRPDTRRSVNPFQALATGNTPGIAVFGQPFWRRYRVRVAVQLRGNGSAGLLFGAGGPDDYGVIRWTRTADAGGLEIAARRNGEERILVTRPWLPRLGQWYELDLALYGDTARVNLAGESISFDLPPTLRHGRCGLYAAGAHGVLFDDVCCDPVTGLQAIPGNATLACGISDEPDWEQHPSQDVALRSRRKTAGTLQLCPLPEGPLRLELTAASSCGAFRLGLGSPEAATMAVEVTPADNHGQIVTAPGRPEEAPMGEFDLAADKPLVIVVDDAMVSVEQSGRTLAAVARGGALPRPVWLRPVGDKPVALAALRADPEAPMAVLQAERQLFDLRLVYGSEKPEPNARTRGMDSWLRDVYTWQRDGNTLRHLTHFWGPLSVTAQLPPPTGSDRHMLQFEDPESGEPLASIGLVRRDGALRVCAGAGGGSIAESLTPRVPAGGTVSVALERWAGTVYGTVGDQRQKLCDLPLDQALRVALTARDAKTDWLRVQARQLSENLFITAPTSWQRWRGHWETSSKWQCTPGWTYMGVWTDSFQSHREGAGVWTTASFNGDQDLQFYLALRDMTNGDPRYLRRDMNLAFCGDGADLASGYSILYGGFENRGVQLLRRGEVVAENTEVKFPPFTGGHQDIHWWWWHCRVLRHGSVIRFLVNNEPVLSYDDPAPLPGGHAGVWTVGGGIIVTRTRFSWQDGGPPLTGCVTPVPPAPPLWGWRPLPGEHPVAIEETTPGRGHLVVTNREAGGRFGVLLDAGSKPPASLSFRYRLPPDVTLHAGIWDGQQVHPWPAGPLAGKPLKNDGRWHSIHLDAGRLTEGEQMVIGYWGDQGYLCVGLGGNRKGSAFELDCCDLGLIEPGLWASPDGWGGQSRLTVTNSDEGQRLRIDFSLEGKANEPAPNAKAAAERLLTRDLRGVTKLAWDVDSHLDADATVALALSTGPDYDYFESPPTPIRPGTHREVTVDLHAPRFKSAHSKWQFSDTVSHLEDVRKVTVLIYPKQRTGRVDIGEFRSIPPE